MQNRIIKMYAVKTYIILIQIAARRETITTQEIIYKIRLEDIGDPDLVIDIMNQVYDRVDTFDDVRDSPRLTGLIIKTRTKLPLKRWFESFLRTIPEGSRPTYTKLNVDQKRAIWENHILQVYSAWDI